MALEEVIVKQYPDLCRCCHSKGNYKDLGEEHTWMNETEVYGDMLQECFNIKIKQLPSANGVTLSICDDCVVRLRDACMFRKQVLLKENKLMEMLEKGQVTENGLMQEGEPCVKSEPKDVKEEPDVNETDASMKIEAEDIEIEEHGITSQHYTAPSVTGGSQVKTRNDTEDRDVIGSENTAPAAAGEPARPGLDENEEPETIPEKLIFTRMFVFEYWRFYEGMSSSERYWRVFKEVYREFSCAESDYIDYPYMQERIGYICRSLAIRWKKSQRGATTKKAFYRHFFTNNREWLNVEENVKKKPKA